MKYSVACLAAITIASPSFAVTPGSSAAVTLALTASIETGGFNGEYEKNTPRTNAAGDVVSQIYEYKSAITTIRYGNAQILEDLSTQGLLDGTTSGWSIISITQASDAAGSSPAIYAIKKGLPPVQIEVTIGGLASASFATVKSIYDVTRGTTSVTGSGNYKQTVSISISDFAVLGTLAGADKIVFGSLGKGADAVSYAFALAGAVKIAAFSGTYSQSHVAEGSLSIAPAKVVDLEALGFSP